MKRQQFAYPGNEELITQYFVVNFVRLIITFRQDNIMTLTFIPKKNEKFYNLLFRHDATRHCVWVSSAQGIVICECWETGERSEGVRRRSVRHSTHFIFLVLDRSVEPVTPPRSPRTRP